MVQRKHSIRRRQLSVNVVRQHLRRSVSIREWHLKLNCDFQKGFGAQKVNTDFKEIERNVQEQEKLREQQAQFEIKTREENEKQMEKQM